MNNLLQLDEPFADVRGVLVYHTKHNDTLCPVCALNTVHLNVHGETLIIDPIVSTEIKSDITYCDGCHEAIVETTGGEERVPSLSCDE